MVRQPTVCLAAFLLLSPVSAPLLAEISVSGTISVDTTWTATNSPYVLTADLTVNSGVSLTIEPGVEVQIYYLESLIVNGSLLALGTESNRVVFTKYPSHSSGGALEFNGGDYSLGATGVFEFCSFSRLSGYPVLETVYTMLSISDCTFSDMLQSKIINPAYSRISVVRNEIYDTREAINAERCAGIIASNYIHDIVGYSDGIDIDYAWAGTGDAMMLIEGNVISNIPDDGGDGIDFGTASGIAKGNIISGCGDKGISVGEGSDFEIYNNLIFDCVLGIAVKDGSTPVMANNTIVNCLYGINSFPKYAQGGRGSFINGVIRDCATSILLEGDSTLDVSYSAIEGASVWPGTGNTTNDPHFVNAGAGDYRLSPSSPCINAGLNMTWMAGAEDLDGNERIIGVLVDMGAYEATLSTERGIWITAPSGGDSYDIERGVSVEWGVYGTNWSGGDTLTFMFSDDSGVAWTQIVDASEIPYDQGSYSWNTTGLVTGDQYLVKAVFDGDAGVNDESHGGDFSIYARVPTALGIVLPASVQEDAGVLWGTGTVVFADAITSNVQVQLLSDDHSELVVTNAVLVAVGQTNAVFDLFVQNDTLRDGNQPVTITISASGYIAASGTVSVLDNDAEIRGVKWMDGNTNGIRDEGESIVNGWRVFVDSDENQEWDTGEPFAFTDASGKYSLHTESGSLLRIAEESRNGWVQAHPGDSVEGGVYLVTETQLDTCLYPNVLTYDFTNAPMPTGDGTLWVTAYADLETSAQYLLLEAEDIVSANLFVYDGGYRVFISNLVSLSQSDIAALANDGAISFAVTPSEEVYDLFPTSVHEELTLTLEYPGLDDMYIVSLSNGELVTNHNFGNVLVDQGLDSDSDGLTDEDELAANTNPFDPDSVLEIQSVTQQGADVRIEWQGGMVVSQFVECCSDLTSETPVWSAIYTSTPPTSVSNSAVHLSVTNDVLFYRILVPE
ncbi:MAG: right-handed parallel beta-helix repeat-containing protein [Kiritimatiellia bacterium]|nr:right-handed parallel beta-helix repeat-containing protein [Kiritimatiellia bacterium]